MFLGKLVMDLTPLLPLRFNMKEIVQELAKLAKASVPHGLDVDKWIEVYNEKLSMLIVNECKCLLEKSVLNYDNRALFHPRQIVEQATNLINEQFGVEQ